MHFSLFYKFRTSKDLEILGQSRYMSHILKGLSKRKKHIPHIALFVENREHKRCSITKFWVFWGGGDFWRVTHSRHLWPSLVLAPGVEWRLQVRSQLYILSLYKITQITGRHCYTLGGRSCDNTNISIVIRHIV